MNQHMDNNSIYARGNSPDSYASGYPPLVLQGMPPAYDFRPQMSPQSHIQNYETFMPAHMVNIDKNIEFNSFYFPTFLSKTHKKFRLL